MPFKLSPAYIDSSLAKTPSASPRAGLARSSKNERMNTVIGAAVAGVTGFGLGYLEGTGGMPKLPGVNLSLDFVGAAAAFGLEFFGKTGSGRTKAIVHDAAVATLGYWSGVQGFMMAKGTLTDAKGVKVTGESYGPMAQGRRNAMGGNDPLWSQQFR